MTIEPANQTSQYRGEAKRGRAEPHAHTRAKTPKKREGEEPGGSRGQTEEGHKCTRGDTRVP